MKRSRFRIYLLSATLTLVGAEFLPLTAWADEVDVKIKGIDNPLLGNVEKMLSLAGKNEDGDWSDRHIRRLYLLAPKEIDQALQPYGYFNPRIKKKLNKPRGDGQTWQARFDIDKGPKTRITRLHIQAKGPGKDLPALQKAMEETELKRGQRLVQPDYDATKGAMYNAAQEGGYLDAHFTQSAMRVDPEDNTAEIDLVMHTGERYYFGDVQFNQDLLDDAFVRRFVPFAPGEIYDPERLIQMQLDLSDTDYYRQVEIDAPRNKARRMPSARQLIRDQAAVVHDPMGDPDEQLRIPVTVTAHRSKGQSYKISPGYGTDTGPRVQLGVKFRHLNKYGHQFRTDARVSQRQRTLQSSYDIPIGDVTQDKLSFSARINNEEFGDITSTIYGLGVDRHTSWAYGRQRQYLRIEREHYDLGDHNRRSLTIYPGYNISFRRADDMMFTRKGASAFFDVRGASDALGSDSNFVRGQLGARGVVPVTQTTRLVLRGDIGAIATDDFDYVPPSQRFFAGGDHSVRGYSYQSLSPTNHKNDQIGGKYLAAGSIEGDWFFYKKFGVAAFFDAGNATNHIGHYKLKKGVGAGFRWGSPVGMVRVDLAHPLDGSSKDIRLHFSLGPDL